MFNEILVANAPFIKNSNQMASRLTSTSIFSRVFFKLLQYSRQRPGFSSHGAALITKTALTFPEFSLRFVDFAFQFCFCCKFWFHDKWRSMTLESSLTVAWFFWTNQNSLLRIATNEIASFCTHNKMASFRVAKVGKGGAKAGFRAILKDFEIKKLSLLYLSHAGQNYWMLIGWDRGHFSLIKRALLVIKRAWLLDADWLSTSALNWFPASNGVWKGISETHRFWVWS